MSDDSTYGKALMETDRTIHKVRSVNVGVARLLQANGRTVMSAIGKRSVDGRVKVNPLGLEGDQQADSRVHGGTSKAVYAYPREHYEHWQTVRAQAQAALWNEPLPDGFMGENLTLEGLLENQVWIGDLLRFPNCQLAVSEPRTPCFKFSAVMGFPQAAQLMLQNAWSGFYLAVREPGFIEAGDLFELVPGPRDIAIPEQFKAITRRKRLV